MISAELKEELVRMSAAQTAKILSVMTGEVDLNKIIDTYKKDDVSVRSGGFDLYLSRIGNLYGVSGSCKVKESISDGGHYGTGRWHSGCVIGNDLLIGRWRLGWNIDKCDTLCMLTLAENGRPNIKRGDNGCEFCCDLSTPLGCSCFDKGGRYWKKGEMGDWEINDEEK